MELRHFRYFVALAEELHFTRAAKRLGISQPPLSQQIQQMEAELATPLFERTQRRVTLTEAGRMFLTEARATLAQAARAETIARRAGRGEIGELRVGLFASAPLLPAFARSILAFRRRLPDVHLSLREGPTFWQVDALQRRELDAGFLRCQGAADLPSDIAAVELFREPLMVAMHRDHPLAKKRGALPLPLLAGEDMIFFSRAVGTSLHEQLAALCRRHGFAPKVTQEVRENSTLLGLVATGLGIAVVPESLLRIRAGDVVARRLLADDATTAVYVATPRDGETQLARALLACAQGG